MRSQFLLRCSFSSLSVQPHTILTRCLLAPPLLTSLVAGGSRQEVCIHPDSVWKRTYACVPFGLWRRSGYPTGDSGEKDDLKAAKKLFGKFRDDYLRCVIEAHFQDDSNARLLEYESPVLVKPTVHGSIFKYPKVNNDGSTHKKNLAYSSSETLESYEANLQNLLLLDAEIGGT